MDSNERERRRQRRYREAMRNRAIAAVVLVALIVGAVFIVKGCKKDETLPADDQQGQQTDTPEENTQKPPANVDDELLTVVNPWESAAGGLGVRPGDAQRWAQGGQPVLRGV